jgi:hypothetical protein
MTSGEQPARDDDDHDRTRAAASRGQEVQVLTCRCARIRRLDGEEASRYAAGHLRLIERGRDPSGAEDYQCDETQISWVLDFPLRHWAQDKHGRPRLRKLPLTDDEPPVGALD